MAPISHLLLPPPALAGCLVAGVFRDTRGAGLSDADRLNHFPASPLVPVTLVRHGSLHVLPIGSNWTEAHDRPAVARKSAMPPQDAPLTSWSPGEVVALTVGVYPDAWHALGGDSDYRKLPEALDRALDAFDGEADAFDGWQAFCAAVEGAWSNCRPDSWHRATGITDWAKSLASRAALSGAGRGIRSFERRIKRYSGHTRRTLAFYAAFEQLHERSVSAAGQPLAELAIDAGFSDQSHMGRAVRRATGFSPARLNKAIETEEPFWCYRLLGERF